MRYFSRRCWLCWATPATCCQRCGWDHIQCWKVREETVSLELLAGKPPPSASWEVPSNTPKSWRHPPKGQVCPKRLFIHHITPEVGILKDVAASHHEERRLLSLEITQVWAGYFPALADTGPSSLYEAD